MRRAHDPPDHDVPGRDVSSRSARPGTGSAPLTGSVAAILALQRQAGNAAVTRTIQRLRSGHDPDQEQTDGHGHEADSGQRSGPEPVQRSAVHEVLRSAGRPLDEPTRTEMEARLGADFSDVRLHTGSLAQRSAAEVGARAYTSGSHVVIGQGGADRHTLAHELTHVIQQRSGPVAGTDDGHGLRVSDPGDAFERAAEANAARVLARPRPEAGTRVAGGDGDAMQRAPEPNGAAQCSMEAGMAGLPRSAGNRFADQATVQRSTTLTVQGQQSVVLTTVAEVRDYLESNGVHFRFKYLEAAEKRVVDDDPPIVLGEVASARDAAQALASQLNSYEPEALATAPPGSQERVQRAFIEMIEVARRRRNGPLDPTKDGYIAYANQVSEWYRQVAANGLCFGWVEMAKRRPELMEQVWAVVQNWTLPVGLSPEDAATSLTITLEHAGLSIGRLVAVLETVWLSMNNQDADDNEPETDNEPEPENENESENGNDNGSESESESEDEYGPLPPEIAQLSDSLPHHRHLRRIYQPGEATFATVEAAEKAIREAATLLEERRAPGFIQIGVGEIHEMGLDFRLPTSYLVLETELLGLRRVNSLEEALNLIRYWLEVAVGARPQEEGGAREQHALTLETYSEDRPPKKGNRQRLKEAWKKLPRFG